MIQMMKKIFYLFDKKARQQTIILLIFMLIGSVLEAFGISLILVFIGIVNDSPGITSSKWLTKIYELSGSYEHKDFIMIFGSFMFCAYLFKNMILLLQSYIQNRFVYRYQAVISRNLLHSYLHGPYIFHLQRNTAELLRNLTQSMGTMFGNGVIPFISFVTELLVVISISTLLFMFEPAVTIYALLIFGGLTLLFYKQVRKKITQYGNRVNDSSTQIILWANQSLCGIKEIKLFGRESFFLNSFAKSRFDNAKYNIYFGTIQKMPRLFLEVLLVGGILLVIIVVISRNDNPVSLIQVLTLFAMASIRLMPSANQIVSSLNSMRFGTSAVNDIYSDIVLFRTNNGHDEGDQRRNDKLDFSHDIRITGLSFQYPDANGPVLNNINFSIKYGTSVAFVGPSGSGKTTLIDIILGLLSPTKGNLLVDGIEISQDNNNLISWQKNIGFIPQDIYLIDDTLRRNIAFGLDDGNIDDMRVSEVIKQAHLEDLVKILPEGVNTNIGERGCRLSGGQRQRVGIARALYNNPKVLIMDEATSSLDNQTESEISRAIEELQGEKTVIIIAHRLSTVKKCDKLFFIKDGSLMDTGTYDELIRTNMDFRRMASEPVLGLVN